MAKAVEWHSFSLPNDCVHFVWFHNYNQLILNLFIRPKKERVQLQRDQAVPDQRKSSN